MKITLRMFTSFISVIVLLALAACGGGDSNTSGSSEDSGKVSAKIGVVTFGSGSGAAYGEAITNGLKLAQSEINGQGDVNIDLAIEDSAGEPDQALSAAQKLMNSENVKIGRAHV